VLQWRRHGEHRRTTLDKLVAGTKVVVAYPDEFLEQLAEKLNSVNVSHLPVVTRDSGQLVGYIGWKDVMRVRLKLRSEEQSRKAFFRIIPRRSIGAADSE
jgi:predicted transcriptional regulator